MVCEECSVLSTHFRIVYGLNTFFFFGRDLFFFGLNVIKKKKHNLKGRFAMMVYSPTVKQLSTAA